MRQSNGFTLIELTVVLALMAILFVAATVSLRGPYCEAKLSVAGEQIELLDQQTRSHARRYGQPAELKLYLGSNTLQVTTKNWSPNSGRRLQLPSGTRIDQVRFADRLLTSGQVTIQFTGQGNSRDFGLRLASSKSRRWVVIAGRTGQAVLINDDQSVKDLLSVATQRTRDSEK